MVTHTNYRRASKSDNEIVVSANLSSKRSNQAIFDNILEVRCDNNLICPRLHIEVSVLKLKIPRA